MQHIVLFSISPCFFCYKTLEGIFSQGIAHDPVIADNILNIKYKVGFFFPKSQIR